MIIKEIDMTTVAIRKKLVDYMQIADDKKIKAMYALLEDDIEQDELEYSPDLRQKLDKAYSDYKNGDKLIPASAANKEINKILRTGKKK